MSHVRHLYNDLAAAAATELGYERLISTLLS